MNQRVRCERGHMDEEWVCLKCKHEIDRVREYCAFDEKSGKRVHTSDCPIYMEEEEYEQRMVGQETMNQVSGAD